MRGFVRILVKTALRAGVMAAVVGLVRRAVGKAAGEPGIDPQGTPMSFDSWPPVPQAPAAQAPAREEG